MMVRHGVGSLALATAVLLLLLLPLLHASQPEEKPRVVLDASSYSVSEDGQQTVCAVLENVVDAAGLDTAISARLTAVWLIALVSAATPDTSFNSFVDLSFAVGSTTGVTDCVDISANDDALIEGPEDFDISLSILSSGPGVLLGNPSTATVTIEDTDVIGAEVSLLSVSAVTEAAGDVPVVITVVLTISTSATLESDLVVTLAPADGALAVLGDDYSFPNGVVVTFSAGSGSSTQTLTIIVLDDDVLEGEHSFTVHIINTNLGVTVGTSYITVTINDDDLGPPPEVTFINDTPVVDAENGIVDAQFTINSIRTVDACCQLLRRNRGDNFATVVMNSSCFSGDPALTTISFTFSGLSPAIYRVRIVVTDDLGQTGVQRKRIVVPDFAIMKNICSVNLINSGVVVTGNDVTLSFREIGVTTGFMCRLDDEDREDCQSPYTRTGLSSGDHRIKIKPLIPDACLNLGRRRPLVVNFTV